MKLSLLVAVAFALTSCATTEVARRTPDSSDNTIAELCRATGLERKGRIERADRDVGKGGNLHVAFCVDGRAQKFEVELDESHQVLRFEPRGFTLEGVKGLGFNEITDRALRRLCLSRVKQVVRTLEIQTYGVAAIQRLGSGFLVTYESLPSATIAKLLKEGWIIEPYVSFAVTERGTVYALILGA